MILLPLHNGCVLFPLDSHFPSHPRTAHSGLHRDFRSRTQNCYGWDCRAPVDIWLDAGLWWYWVIFPRARWTCGGHYARRMSNLQWAAASWMLLFRFCSPCDAVPQSPLLTPPAAGPSYLVLPCLTLCWSGVGWSFSHRQVAKVAHLFWCRFSAAASSIFAVNGINGAV